MSDKNNNCLRKPSTCGNATYHKPKSTEQQKSILEKNQSQEDAEFKEEFFKAVERISSKL